MPSSTKTPQTTSSQLTKTAFELLPDCAFLRMNQLVLPPNAPPDCFSILPFSLATLRRMIDKGSFPKPVKLSANMVALVAGDVRKWIKEQTGV